MTQSTGRNWFLLSGVLFAVLYVGAGIQMGELGFLPSGEEAAALLGGDPDRFWLVGYIGTLSGFFLLWFSGSVRAWLRLEGRDNGPLADIAFAGGITAGALLAAAYATIPALSERAAEGVSPDLVLAVTDQWGGLSGVAMPIAFGAFVGATGLSVLRTRALPRWFGWASIVLAVGLISPVMYIVMTLGLLWALALSLWLFARGGREPARAPEAVTPTPA